MFLLTNRKKHVRHRVEEAGLLVSDDLPFLGCSVDGIVSCACHNRKLLEIKSPYQLRDNYPKEAALQRDCYLTDNNIWELKRNSKYYYQIQGQLGLYKLQLCDLFYTKKDIHIVPVSFDHDFYTHLVQKFASFYRDHCMKILVAKAFQGLCT